MMNRFLPPIETKWFEVAIAPESGQPPAKIRRNVDNILEVWLELPEKVWCFPAEPSRCLCEM